MLAIRLQRTGRSGHAQFRVIVQDSRFSPKRGRVVAYLGSYNPHTKAAVIDSESTSKYLQNGARPSDRVARLLKQEGVKLPAWVKLDEPRKRDVRNPEKRRSTRPAEPAAPAEPTAEQTAEETSTEAPLEAPAEAEAVPEEPAAADEPEAAEKPTETAVAEQSEETPPEDSAPETPTE